MLGYCNGGVLGVGLLGVGFGGLPTIPRSLSSLRKSFSYDKLVAFMYLGDIGDPHDNIHSKALTAFIGPSLVYVAYPPPTSRETTRYERIVDDRRAAHGTSIFLGQVPHHLPLQYVAWAVDLLLAEYAVKWVLKTQRNGCARVWCITTELNDELTRRTGRLLFDIRGVWVAYDARAADRIRDYVNSPFLIVDPRLPRRPLVAEVHR